VFLQVPGVLLAHRCRRLARLQNGRRRALLRFDLRPKNMERTIAIAIPAPKT
jgi:hypothetical protein